MAGGYDSSKDVCLARVKIHATEKSVLEAGIYSYSGGDPKARFVYVSKDEGKFQRKASGLSHVELVSLSKVLDEIIKEFKVDLKNKFKFFVVEDEGKEYLATDKKLRGFFDSKKKLKEFKNETKLKYVKELGLYRCRNTKKNIGILTKSFRKYLNKTVEFKLIED